MRTVKTPRDAFNLGREVQVAENAANGSFSQALENLLDAADACSDMSTKHGRALCEAYSRGRNTSQPWKTR